MQRCQTYGLQDKYGQNWVTLLERASYVEFFLPIFPLFPVQHEVLCQELTYLNC